MTVPHLVVRGSGVVARLGHDGPLHDHRYAAPRWFRRRCRRTLLGLRPGFALRTPAHHDGSTVRLRFSGYLDGAAGAALTLHSYAVDGTPADWDAAAAGLGDVRAIM